MQNGFYLAPNVFVRSDGKIFGLVNTDGGMAGVDWSEIGDFAGDMFDKVIKFKQAGSQSQLQQQQLQMQQQAMLQAQLAQNQNPLSQLGGLSTPMLLILGLVGVVLFMKK